MKKLCTLCLIAFTFLAFSNTAIAQDKYGAIDEDSKRFSTEMQEVLNLDENQTALVWRAFYVKKKNEMEQLGSNAISKDEKKRLQQSFDGDFKKRMQEILTDEQFKTYTYWLQKQTKE